MLQDKGNNGNKAKSMVESPSKGHKRRHGGGGAGGTAGGGTGGEVPGPDREQAGNGNEDERGQPRQKKKKNDANSEVTDFPVWQCGRLSFHSVEENPLKRIYR
jgi:hypothetical protein